MSQRIAAVLVGLFLVGCAHEPAGSAAAVRGTGDAAYEKLADQLLDAYLAWRPALAVSLGLHQYDGKTADWSAASIGREQARLHQAREALSAIDQSTLSPDARTSLRNFLSGIDGELFNFAVSRAYVRNPMTYTDISELNSYVKREYAPLKDRVRPLISALKAMPARLAASRENLQAILPKPLVETAISDGKGAVEFLNGDLVTAVAPVNDEPLLAEFKAAKDAAAAAMTGFVTWLESDRLPQADPKFGLGRDAFMRMLSGNELITQSPEEVLAIGLKELAREQANFVAAAKAIDPTKKPTEVFSSIKRDHPTPEGLIPDTRRNLEAIRQFLVDHDIITIPSDVRVRVEETPKYQRTTTSASMDTPGPFEQSATEAYYYVTPTEPEWPAERKEEWLTSFNYFTTDVVTIHEAYPGHYVQFLHLNASHADRVSKVFGSYAFIEGWAHYSEQMLLEEGFGQGRDPLTAAKYRLAQSTEALLRICRLCMSIRMHCEGWTIDQATKFFVENCFYEEAPSRAEAVRGASDPGYLFYTVGKLELLKLRQDWRRQEGAAFSLRRFHDAVLAHGMPPVRLLREFMLHDSATWNDLF